MGALASGDADAEAFYGVYGPSLYYRPHHPFTAPGFVAPPLLRTFPAPSVRRVVTKTVQAAPAPSLIAQAAVPAVPAAVVSQPASPAVPSVVSSQYHSQDEETNFAFGYSNINSARHEAGNAYTGVAGSYTDGRNTVNYVADS